MLVITIECPSKVRQRGGQDSVDGQPPQSEYNIKDHNIAGVN
jgi:hypothetical protein